MEMPIYKKNDFFKLKVLAQGWDVFLGLFHKTAKEMFFHIINSRMLTAGANHEEEGDRK